MIGVRGHDLGVFTTDTIDELIKKIKLYDYKHIQLVLWKSFSDIGENLEGLTEDKMKKICQKFKENDIKISVLGAYYNMISPNLEERKKGFERYKKLLHIVKKLGGSFVATETGSFNQDMSFTKRNHSSEAFEIVLDSFKDFTQIAEKERSFAGVEGVYTLSVWNIDVLKNLYYKLNSNNMRFIFDPVNLISEENYLQQDKLITDFFNIFGESIEVIHFKDFLIEDGKLIRVAPGKGILNYPLLIENMKRFNLGGVIEEIDETLMPDAITYIKNLI
ncbi:sugar phosphate isomerase/epimerase family protein [Cetobacterium sp.]|uniref:sugar phosphate isomerase/epimerase family protein n=1 Tax=Cetobacterium sp. TaxID=2071632 RepID=UPI003F3B9D61